MYKNNFPTPGPKNQRPIFKTIHRILKLAIFQFFTRLKVSFGNFLTLISDFYSFTGGTNQNDSIDSNMKKLCGELAWYVQALENQKSSANGVPKSIMASWELIAA